MADPRLVHLAVDLQLLGVSRAGVMELLGYPPERVEAQLKYLPYRKAKRPEAFIIEAVRNDYSPPKEFFYAKDHPHHPGRQGCLDQDAEPPVRPPTPKAPGYRAEDSVDPHSPDPRLAPGGEGCELALPPAEESHGTGEDGVDGSPYVP